MQKKSQELDAESSDPEVAENSNDDQEIDSEDEEKSGEREAVNAGTSGLDATEKPQKKKKRGIIYISSIPKFMNVTILREMLSQHAKIGRIFLQPGKLSGELIELLKSINSQFIEDF